MELALQKVFKIINLAFSQIDGISTILTALLIFLICL
jgi:hypothetical protein